MIEISSQNPRGFSFEIVWADEDILEVRLHATSGTFSGTAYCYAALGESTRFAEHLAGFPRNSTEVRKYHLGEDAPGMLPSGASITLKCADGLGHLSIAVEIWARTMNNEHENVSLVFRTVAAEIDTFVAALRSMGNQMGIVTRLQEAI